MNYKWKWMAKIIWFTEDILLEGAEELSGKTINRENINLPAIGFTPFLKTQYINI